METQEDEASIARKMDQESMEASADLRNFFSNREP